MNTIIELPEEINEKLNFLSEITNKSRELLISEAIKNLIEDMEDIYLAEKEYESFKKKNQKPISLTDMEKMLGLED